MLTNFKTVTIGHSDTPPSFKFYQIAMIKIHFATNLLLIIFNRLLFWMFAEHIIETLGSRFL
jgi:hypothetical protein